ncbi:MAG: HAD hydrolase-like protein [Veillonellaceae bacterium]|nr:HAD hydrolase-like protein [Veillonellaceae bacterium]
MIAVLFDLDGTLTDSKPGILNSVKYALEKTHHPIPDEKTLQLFIGPPLLHSFKEHCHMTDQEADETYSFFHERYISKGMFENEPYPHIKEMLSSFRQGKAYIGVATAKPEVEAIEILKHYDLAPMIDIIKGAHPKEGVVEKYDILQSALNAFQAMTDGGKKKITRYYMVGDRKYDIEAAKRLQCRALAVTYGYGFPEELEAAKPDYMCHSPEDILLNVAVDGLL